MQGTYFGLGGGREVALHITANWGGSSKWFIWEKGCLDRILEVLWLPETLNSLDVQQRGCSQHLQVKKTNPEIGWLTLFAFLSLETDTVNHCWFDLSVILEADLLSNSPFIYFLRVLHILVYSMSVCNLLSNSNIKNRPMACVQLFLKKKGRGKED